MIVFMALLATACLAAAGWLVHSWLSPHGAFYHPQEFWVPAGVCLLMAFLLIWTEVTQ